MLDELSRYTDEMKRKFDIIAAMGLCELGDEDMMGVTPRQIENTDDFFRILVIIQTQKLVIDVKV